jgi:predicted Zn-dependent protease
LRDKDLEKAIISLRIVTKETPENIEAYLMLAKIHEIEGNKEQQKSALHSAYANNKTNHDGLLMLAKYHLTRDIAQSEKIIDNYNAIKENNYEGLSIKTEILSQNKQYSESYKIAELLMEKFPEKANGYLQSVPYLSSIKDKKTAISNLEKGYLNVKENRKLLIVLTSLQSAEKEFDIVEKRLIAEIQ